MLSSTAHARIERVGLEDDADIAVPRFDVVDPRAVERDLAARRTGRCRRASVSVVVLPQPDGPSTATKAPSSIREINAPATAAVAR